MAFNHYAKLATIIAALDAGWYIRRIDKPTSSKTFSGETKYYSYYYRLYTNDGTQVPYGKFQQIERLAQILKLDSAQLPVIEE